MSCEHVSESSIKQEVCFCFSSFLLVHFVGAMVDKEETLCKETALQLDQDTIAAIINGVTTKLQKAPPIKGMSLALQ